MNVEEEDTTCCCCCSSRVGTLIIAVLSTFQCIAQFILLGLGFVALLAMPDGPVKEFHGYGRTTALVVVAIDFIFTMSSFILSLLMWCGAAKRKPSKASPWFYFNVILFILHLIFFVLLLVSLQWEPAIGLGIYLIIYFYMLFVVSTYTNTRESTNTGLSTNGGGGVIYMSTNNAGGGGMIQQPPRYVLQQQQPQIQLI